jgi:hypothetical protein
MGMVGLVLDTPTRLVAAFEVRVITRRENGVEHHALAAIKFIYPVVHALVRSNHGVQTLALQEAPHYIQTCV